MKFQAALAPRSFFSPTREALAMGRETTRDEGTAYVSAEKRYDTMTRISDTESLL